MKKTTLTIPAVFGIVAAIALTTATAHAFQPRPQTRANLASDLADEACVFYLPNHEEYLECYNDLYDTYKE